jgi:hypothetical protein
MTDTATPFDQAKFEQALGRFLGDVGSAFTAVSVLTGDKLGFYKQVAGGPLTSEELAQRTGTHERYVREWLANQAAAGYISRTIPRRAASRFLRSTYRCSRTKTAK